MKWKNKKRAWKLSFKAVLIIVMLFLTGSMQEVAFAQAKESETVQEETKIPEETKEETEEKEVRYPNKLEAKEPPKNNQNSGDDSKENKNKGIPTQPSSAKAQQVESVNNANKDYPIYHGESDGQRNNKYTADARQFITFQTKSGKTFHLIINHDEEGQNVMLLTEVSEDDLLNMVEIKEKPKEEVKKIEEPVPEIEVKKEEVKKEEHKGNWLYLFLGIVIIAVIGVGYYFKIYKKKQEEQEEDEEEYDEFEDEYEKEKEIEDSEESTEEDEEQDIEDMARDVYEKEEEE